MYRKTAAKSSNWSNASAFIRHHPDVATSRLVQMGREQGVTFSTSLVHVVRRQDRERSRKTQNAILRLSRAYALPPLRSTQPKPDPDQAELRRILLRVGTETAREWIAQYEAAATRDG